MPDTKISDLTAVTDVLATDEYVLARSGQNKKIDASDLIAGFGVYVGYTPTWTGGSPSIGNGTLDGRYVQIGKLVHVQFRMIGGSSTNFGGAAWTFSLPVTMATGRRASGTVEMNNSGSAYFGISIPADTSSMYIFRLLEPATAVGSSAPFAWGDGDFLHASLVYEAA